MFVYQQPTHAHVDAHISFIDNILASPYEESTYH